MKNENNEALALLFGVLLVVGAALWSANTANCTTSARAVWKKSPRLAAWAWRR